MKQDEYDRLPSARQKTLAFSAPQATISARGVLGWGVPVAISAALREGAEHYDPYGTPELTNALSKVVDERSALRFARRYGLLGYAGVLFALKGQAASSERRGREADPLLDRRGVDRLFRDLHGDYGDPLPWLYGQARSVRLALALVQALPQGPEAIAAVVREQAPLRGDLAAPAVRPLQLAYGLQLHEVDLMDQLLRPRARKDLPEAELRPLLAALLIEELVNSNTAGLQWRLFSLPTDGSYELALGFRQRALFEVIWWHVGNTAASGRDGAEVRLCKLATCRAPFIVTDQRQRFCPADYPYTDKKTGRTRPGRSRCAALYQKRHGGKSKEAT